MKYYYTDPLIVAYMARKFNIITEQGSVENGDYIINDRASFFHYLKEELPKTINSNVEHRYYIHTSCVEILKPQVGDLITSNHKFELDKNDDEFPGSFVIAKSDEMFPLTCLSQFILTEENYDNAWSDYHFEGQEIIQRNGKAFFMPEVEND